MKTNQIMRRHMGQFEVLQRTSDSMFNATSLLKQWNKSNPDNKRELDNFWKSTHLVELMKEIAENEYGTTSVDFTVLKNVVSKTSKARFDRGGGTWMHPILFIKFAMYLSPKFEYNVLRFVYDELIQNRHLAGDKYKKLTSSIAKLPDVDYSQIAKALNYIVFNKHHPGIRNEATCKQLEELHSLEDKLAMLIDMEYVNNQQELITAMRKIYDNKYRKF